MHTDGGRITAVTGFDDAPDGTVTLADDEVLLPGPRRQPRARQRAGAHRVGGLRHRDPAAAIAGGVTTIVDMPLNSIPPTTTVEALHVKREVAKGQVSADVAFWGGAVPGNVDQLRPLHEAGVVGFKCFLLDSGVPEFPPLDDAGLRAALTELADFDGLLIAHAEDADVIAAAPGAERPRATPGSWRRGRGGRGVGDRPADRGRPGDTGRPGARRPPGRRRRAADAAAGPGPRACGSPSRPARTT